VTAELARSKDELATGLMNREKLEADAGMLFVFPKSAVWPFWMKDTRIPLDMIFMDENGRVLGVVERATPMSLEHRTVEAPSRYVLEVNGGWAQAHGIAAGAQASFATLKPGS
jgi:uncharacterized membrane protein (UPF0127 family)